MSVAVELEPIKRSIVSLVGRFYDPMVLSPIVVRYKIFLQELCEAKLEWNEPLGQGIPVGAKRSPPMPSWPYQRFSSCC